MALNTSGYISKVLTLTKYIEELNARQSLIAEPEPMVLKERPKGYGPR